MMISRINSTYDNMNIKQNVDNSSSSLQTKLMAEQRRLKAVDSDTNMDAAQKTKEKLKIQQQIDELNRKMKIEELEKEQAGTKPNVLAEEVVKSVQKEEDKDKKIDAVDDEKGNSRESVESSDDREKVENAQQHQIAKDSEKTEEKSVYEKQIEEAKEKEESENKNREISPQEIHKMLSGDFELQRERVLNQVSNKEESAQDILRAEIKSDTIQGTDTEAKKEKLVQMREQRPVQIEAVELERNDKMAKAQSGVKVVIREDAII